MKKKFIAFLMSVTMISGSLALPVYAENEEVSVEFSNDEEMCGDLKTEELEDHGKTDILVETDASDEDTEDFSDQLVTEDFSVEIETCIPGTHNEASDVFRITTNSLVSPTMA